MNDEEFCECGVALDVHDPLPKPPPWRSWRDDHAPQSIRKPEETARSRHPAHTPVPDGKGGCHSCIRGVRLWSGKLRHYRKIIDPATERVLPETCGRGHQDWRIRPADGRRECRECVRVRARARHKVRYADPAFRAEMTERVRDWRAAKRAA